MKRFAGLFGALVIGTGVVGVTAAGPAGAAPPLTFTCTGAISNVPLTVSPEVVPPGTYGSFVMPPGSFCVIPGPVTVQKGITLGSGSALIVVDGFVPGGGPFSGALTVEGPVRVGPDADLNFLWDGTTPLTAPPLTVNGPVSVQSHGLFGMFGATISGPLTATDASGVQVSGSQIRGPLSVVGGGGTNDPSEAFAQVGFFPGYNFVDLEQDTVSGPLSVLGYDGAAAYVGGDHTGPMTFSDNTAAASPYWPPPLYITHFNVINGPATCADNSPTPNATNPSDGSTNTVSGPVRGDQGTACFG